MKFLKYQNIFFINSQNLQNELTNYAIIICNNRERQNKIYFFLFFFYKKVELKYDENSSPLEKQILKNMKNKETIFIFIE